MDERELVLKSKKGDDAAFCELYGLYKKKLFNYAYYKLGNVQDAEDAVSECVLSAYRQIGQLKNETAFSAWIFRILYCCCTEGIKAQMKQRNTDNIDDFVSLSGADDDRYIKAAELKHALNALTDEERDIVLLSVAAGLKSREISKISGLTPGGVRSKLSRSLAKMKQELI